ncbi:uncharacterized protein HaLaN_05744, partial [Haematococcus lacustris]
RPKPGAGLAHGATQPRVGLWPGHDTKAGRGGGVVVPREGAGTMLQGAAACHPSHPGCSTLGLAACIHSAHNVMMDDNLALVLSPQSFHNIKPETDIFNNINKQFWECWLPGAFAWGYIACTGTNFCIRTRALAHCGWFPEYTITEDYALGMELKCHGYQATYLMLYLAVGEAPEEIRNVFRQRSRWTKGHFQ